MVASVTYKIKRKDNLRLVKNIVNEDEKVKVGILHNPAMAALGELQHNGGSGVYYYGPYKGESVSIPARPFIQAPVNNFAPDIIRRVLDDTDFSETGFKNAKERIGNWLKAKILEYFDNAELGKTLNPTANGDGGNSGRTIATKGFDHPLFDKGNLRNSISYEVGK